MVALRKKEGMAGVGIYWCLVEMLYEEGGYMLHTEYENVGFELRVKPETIRRIVCTYELFSLDGEKFWSESALKRLEKRNSLSGKNKEIALEGWKRRKQYANALPTHSDRNALKERKGKESKEKEIVLPHGEIFAGCWDEWKKFRTEKHQKLTLSTIKKQLANLGARAEADACAVIQQSITNGWTGLFDVKTNLKPNNGKPNTNSAAVLPEGKHYGNKF